MMAAQRATTASASRRCTRCPTEVFWAQAAAGVVLLEAAPVDSTVHNVHVVLVDRRTRPAMRRARPLPGYLDRLGEARGWTRAEALAEVLREHTLHVPHVCRPAVLTTHAAITAEASDGS